MSRRAQGPDTSGEQPRAGLSNDPLWYKDAIIYEVRTRSFFDSNGADVDSFRLEVFTPDAAFPYNGVDYVQNISVADAGSCSGDGCCAICCCGVGMPEEPKPPKGVALEAEPKEGQGVPAASRPPRAMLPSCLGRGGVGFIRSVEI